MNLATVIFLPASEPRWLAWLERELAPTPGRGVGTVRVVIATALVTATSMTLRVPHAAASAFLVLLISNRNLPSTLLSGMLLIVGATLAIGATVLVLPYVVDRPELRMPLMTLLLLGGMYFSRVFVVGPLAFATGFIMALALGEVSTMPADGEIIVRGCLWIWVAAVYAIVITVVVSRFLLPTKQPLENIAGELDRRLAAAHDALRRKLRLSPVRPSGTAALRDYASRGIGSLRGLLKISGKGDTARRLAALLAPVENVLFATVTLDLADPETLSASDREILTGLDAELARLRPNLATKDIPLPTVSPNLSARTDLRALQEALYGLQLAAAGSTPQPAAARPKAKIALFKPGGFGNPTHLQFAIKVTLAGMFCYIVYTAVDWPGIQTAFITCCVCALESTGATLRKMNLRITGCLIGGGLGFVTLIYLVPHMEGIVSLLLVSACVTALAAWIALGSERISYAGVQMNLAFYMCLLQHYDPPTDLDVIRDRVVGMLLGIVAVSFAFRYLWPEQAADRLRASLAQLLRQVGEFVVSPGIEKRSALTGQFDATQRLSEQAMFEMDFHYPEEVTRKRRLDDLIGQAQTYFLAAAAAVPTPELQERVKISRRLQAEAEILTEPVHQGKCI